MQPVSEPTTATLAAWIAARLDETEALALAAASAAGHHWDREPFNHRDVTSAIDAHIAANDPAAVLRRIEADRKILSLHSGTHHCGLDEDDVLYFGPDWDDEPPTFCPTLLALASQWADHPEFRSEWA